MELFGETPRWGDTLRPFLWTHVSLTVTGFTGRPRSTCPITCTYDFEVAAAKYLHALDDGEIPLVLLFSGTVVRHGAQPGFSAAPVVVDEEASYRLPVQLWRDMMDLYFPNSGWLRLRRDTLDALQRFKAERALPTWDETFERLLKEAGETDEHIGARDPAVQRRPVRVGTRWSPTPCSTRATCCTRTGPRRRRTSCAGSSACSLRPDYASVERIRALVDAHRGDRRPGRSAAADRAGPLPAGAAPRIEARDRRRHVLVPVDVLDVDGITLVPWDEAVEHEIDLDPCRAAAGRRRAAASTRSRCPPATTSRCSVTTAATSSAGRCADASRSTGSSGSSTEWADGRRAVAEGDGRRREHDRLDRCRPRRRQIATPSCAARWSPCTRCWPSTTASFVSLLEPAAACGDGGGRLHQRRHVPRAGRRRREPSDVMLSSPIILYDHPGVAPESPGDFCDATEIDEILALRVLTLTDEEKAEARGTDPRAAAIIDRCDDMPPEIWARLHGAVRSLRPIVPTAVDTVTPPSPMCRGGSPGWTPSFDPSPTPC